MDTRSYLSLSNFSRNESTSAVLSATDSVGPSQQSKLNGDSNDNNENEKKSESTKSVPAVAAKSSRKLNAVGKVSSKTVKSITAIPSKSKPVLKVECPYKTAGCTELLIKGTFKEKNHPEVCPFRPLPCLFTHFCSELVPYQNFLLHHSAQHFMCPMYSTNLNTTVAIEKGDFESSLRWYPRWINCYKRDFFLMVSHKDQMWYAWVWMLGSEDEAKPFFYDIELHKGPNKKGGMFNVQSLRTGVEEIEKGEICFSTTDYQIKRISQIRDNLISSFEIDLTIFKEYSNN